MRLINTLRMIRGWWGEKDFWMATLADCLWRGRLWVVYHIANHVHEEKTKKLGTTYSSETFDQRWSAISTCVARTRAGVTARVLSQAPTPHCTKLWDSVWYCVTVCDSVWHCSEAELSFFLGASWPPWCCRCSWPPVGSWSTKSELGFFRHVWIVRVYFGIGVMKCFMMTWLCTLS